MLPEPQSPRTGLALSDLQSTSAGGTYAIGGGGISGLAISSSHGSNSWSTRGVGGIGAGVFEQSSAGSSGMFGNGAGVGGNQGSSSGNKVCFNFFVALNVDL
uniref:Uncharacterized protein n=1 Tax=Panagrolaimus sp. ES5 TaxID=591445 RepID=A0AC34GDU3_9BILA